MGIEYNREDGGRLVREAWIRCARTYPLTVLKRQWLRPWEQLEEYEREADRCIWDEIVAPYVTQIAQLVEENRRLRDYLDKEAAIETSLQIIAGGIANLRLETLVVKAHVDTIARYIGTNLSEEEGE